MKSASGEEHPLEHYDAIVLGAGISGLVSARILTNEEGARVVVVDEYPSVGGNHLDKTIGDYTFDVGSFIFQDDSPLLRWFPELMHDYVPIEPSWSRLNPQGVVTQYPFSIRDDLLRSGPLEILRVAISAINARFRSEPLENARDFAEHWLGPVLADRSGLLHYMERFCGIPSDQIDLQFAQSRMGWIAEYAQFGTYMRRFDALRKRRAAQPPPRFNQQLVRPKKGFASLYNPVMAHLEADGATFKLGTRPDRLVRDGSEFVLQVGAQVLRADRVVSTIPIDHALRLIGVKTDPLPTVTLITLFYSFAGERGFSTSILYNFSSSASWKRLTVYSDFYGAERGREYFAVEVIRHAGATIESVADEFRAHSAKNGLLHGDLRLEGGHVLANAYPIYTKGSGARARSNIAVLNGFGLESFGRQGGFEYQPTARVSTEVAEFALGVGDRDLPSHLPERETDAERERERERE